ncbi:MAG: ABC transporter ATP-binding protein [Clostridia bacterium]|nr:ABC transporter ATP-binding protein [Clostridia bacterium]
MDKINDTVLVSAGDVTLSYDSRPVVENLTFAVTRGMYLCIVGANGSGKSTLMRAVTGILRPSSGVLRVGDGVTIGYLPQQSEIQRDFPASVWEVALSGCLGRVKNRLSFGFGYDAASRERAEKALAMLGMEHLKKRSYNELSGGQQQRVLLARALCASDDLLLLDEPVTGLDPDAAREMYAIIRRLNDNGTAILMVTHDMEAALEESSHILCLCQRHGGAPAKGRNHSNFFGPTEQYRAGLAGDECSCCGMSHDRQTTNHRPMHRTIQIPGSISLGSTMDIARARRVDDTGTDRKGDSV